MLVLLVIILSATIYFKGQTLLSTAGYGDKSKLLSHGWWFILLLGQVVSAFFIDRSGMEPMNGFYCTLALLLPSAALGFIQLWRVRQ